LEVANDTVSAMVQQARAGGGKVALGHVLVASAEIMCAQDSDQLALDAADEAVAVFRDARHGKGLASALDAGFRAHAALGEPKAGLRAANRELESIRTAGDRKMEVCVLEMLAHAHAMLEEPHSAINAAKQAEEIHRSTGDKEGEGTALLKIAEMRWALGELAEATEVARQAYAAFVAANSTWGQEQAKATISSLLATRGQMEKAPNRQEAVKALRELARAVEKRDMNEAKSAEERLNKMRDLVSDQEVVEHLQPLLQKDAGAMEFLKQLGWNFGETEGLPGTLIKQFPHEAFYLHTIMTGMGFGPQFRSVHPWRKGRVQTDYHAITVSQLPETEAWQMELGFRPGIIDSTFQSLSVIHFP